MKLAGILAVLVLVLVQGCSTNPITGRNQILALPAVQSAHADVSFALSTGAWSGPGIAACKPDCGAAGFSGRVTAIGARLEALARGFAPDLFERIAKFEIEVNDSVGAGTGSSAGGRIVVGSGLAALEPSDAVIAFLVAREMAHVIARHAEEDAGASIAFSILGMLLPGFNVIARFVATRAGSRALIGSWAAQQQREADEIAVALLDRAGMPASLVALELDIGIVRADLPGSEWGARYLESAQRVAAIDAATRRNQQEVLDRAQADVPVTAAGAGIAFEPAAFAAPAATAE